MASSSSVVSTTLSETALPFNSVRVQLPVALISLGHGASHWVLATFYLVLPFIARDLGLSYVETGAIVTCLHVGAALANIPGGTLVDLTGRRVIIQTAALIASSMALFGFGLAQAYAALCALAALLGASNMLWHPAAISYLSRHLPNNRGYALSMHSLGANLGDAMAPLLAGWLLLSMSWKTTAEINAVFSVGAALVILLLLRSDRGPTRANQTVDWSVYFRSLIDTFKTGAVWSLCLIAGFRTATQGSLLVFLPLFLVNELKTDTFWTGLTLMMVQVGGMIATPIAGVASDRIGRRAIVLGGIFFTSASIVALCFVRAPALFVVCVSALGFFMYAIRPVIHSWLMDVSPGHLAATMTSTMFGVQALLSMLGPLVGGWLADRYGLGSVFYFLAGMVLVANLLGLTVPKAEPR